MTFGFTEEQGNNSSCCSCSHLVIPVGVFFMLEAEVWDPGAAGNKEVTNVHGGASLCKMPLLWKSWCCDKIKETQKIRL